MTTPRRFQPSNPRSRVNADLSWKPALGALSHDVYFGTDFDDVNDANTSSPQFMGNQVEPIFDPNTFEPNTSYYWRIDEKNKQGTTKGDVLTFTTSSSIGIFYVDDDATGLNNGTSWTDAYNDLQDALAKAFGGDEIWVAEGTYKPTDTNDPSISFEVRGGVGLYGGFEGTETDPNQRDPNLNNNLTILSGDIGTVNDVNDNSYHVVTVIGPYDSGPCMERFKITGGNARLSTFRDACGGGLLNHFSQLTVTDCMFTNNYAKNNGGAVLFFGSSGTITGCIFSENAADGYGTAVCCKYSDANHVFSDCTFTSNDTGIGCLYATQLRSATLTITNCAFSGNASDAIMTANTQIMVKDCTITGNSGSGAWFGTVYWSVTVEGCIIGENGNWGIGCGGGTSVVLIKNNLIYKNRYDGIRSVTTLSLTNNTIVSNGDYGIRRLGGAAPTISNCIIWGHEGNDLFNCNATYSCIEDCNDASGTGNICGDANDPLFVNADNNDFHLDYNSPCIGLGDPNGAYDGQWDIDGSLRVIDVNVDIGADEVCQYPTDDSNDYNEWISVGKPDCWCYLRQCHGDADGLKQGNPITGYMYVSTYDLIVLQDAWQIKEPPKGPGLTGSQICADFNHAKQGSELLGYYRVGTDDLVIFSNYWQIKEPPKGDGVDPNCLDCGG